MTAQPPTSPAPRRIGPDTATDTTAGKVVAIIGAGFSGTMAAIHLRHSLPPDHAIYLFEKTGRFARGPAFAPSSTPHLLNVRAQNMSALPDDPLHFDRWVAARLESIPNEVSDTPSGRFATRRLYGRYLRALLYDEMSRSGGRVRLGADDVTALVRRMDGWRLHRAGGRSLDVAHVVLAVGTLPSSKGQQGVIFHDPWADAASSNLRPDEPVLIVGTGLTMIDVVLGMRAKGFQGPIIAASRRGLVPQRHAPPGAPWTMPTLTQHEQRSLPALLARIRREIQAASRQGIGWRAVIDSLRPLTPGLWQNLPTAERDRFLRHLRPYWDIHRHRMAPSVSDRFDHERRTGALRLVRGRVRAVEADATHAHVTLDDLSAHTAQTLTVQRIIYATGLGAANGDAGLIAHLRRDGLARSDRHGLGLDVSETLQVIGADGCPTERLWALGPIVRGIFWECTAVPDIRVQARMIATEIARELTNGPASGRKTPSAPLL